MKKLIFGSLVLAIGLVGIIGCEKEVVNTNTTTHSGAVEKKPVIYHATWDEWGRAAKDCKGWGLCNFSDCWFCDDGEALHIADVIFDDETNEGNMIIELDPTDPIQNDAIINKRAFHIDYDIDNPNSLLHKGTYAYDSSVGAHGGYTLAITIK